MSFRYVAYHSVYEADHVGARIRVNGSLMRRLDRFFEPGTVTEVSIDSLQQDDSGRTRYGFLEWSDGGARTHVVTSQDQPDTIVARLAVSHRLRTAVQGGTSGIIVSDLNANIENGVFLPEGSRVALRAEPQPKAVFARWTGDTASTRDTLSLTMSHPFDLTATFVAVREVAIGDAAGALLGDSPLADDAAAYLDAAGNRNGRYDLGDFLAQVDRSPGAGAAQLSRSSPR
jgi:hypothetical protein